MELTDDSRKKKSKRKSSNEIVGFRRRKANGETTGENEGEKEGKEWQGDGGSGGDQAQGEEGEGEDPLLSTQCQRHFGTQIGATTPNSKGQRQFRFEETGNRRDEQNVHFSQLLNCFSPSDQRQSSVCSSSVSSYSSPDLTEMFRHSNNSSSDSTADDGIAAFNLPFPTDEGMPSAHLQLRHQQHCFRQTERISASSSYVCPLSLCSTAASLPSPQDFAPRHGPLPMLPHHLRSTVSPIGHQIRHVQQLHIPCPHPPSALPFPLPQPLGSPPFSSPSSSASSSSSSSSASFSSFVASSSASSTSSVDFHFTSADHFFPSASVPLLFDPTDHKQHAAFLGYSSTIFDDVLLGFYPANDLLMNNLPTSPVTEPFSIKYEYDTTNTVGTPVLVKVEFEERREEDTSLPYQQNGGTVVNEAMGNELDDKRGSGEAGGRQILSEGANAMEAQCAAVSSALCQQSAEEPDALDTLRLAQHISQELKRYSIPQAIFAQRVLCRSQGTLSDLLRNPKPWSKLKSGRETFRRMAKWLQEPEGQRMAALRLAACKRKEEQTAKENLDNASDGRGGDELAAIRKSGQKKPRLVFTEIQRRTLQAIFKETKRPSRELQLQISHQLNLDTTTVANYFMNARRRGHDREATNCGGTNGPNSVETSNRSGGSTPLIGNEMEISGYGGESEQRSAGISETREGNGPTAEEEGKEKGEDGQTATEERQKCRHQQEEEDEEQLLIPLCLDEIDLLDEVIGDDARERDDATEGLSRTPSFGIGWT
ncbi:hypothetical protein niasHS_007302 [Heterodera schachtii]|uniref:One cut domain family member n=1 Tax=Heterodera schachtii TaxID=97005 RepID=A0ABD2JK15_HETSC